MHYTHRNNLFCPFYESSVTLNDFLESLHHIVYLCVGWYVHTADIAAHGRADVSDLLVAKIHVSYQGVIEYERYYSLLYYNNNNNNNNNEIHTASSIF